MDEARRAYRDLVRVWHPDRFAGDPRLRSRAEERVKLLNTAYDTLVRHLARRKDAETGDQHSLSSTEAFFEGGTRKVLTVLYSLRRAAHSALKDAAGKGEDQKPLKKQ